MRSFRATPKLCPRFPRKAAAPAPKPTMDAPTRRALLGSAAALAVATIPAAGKAVEHDPVPEMARQYDALMAESLRWQNAADDVMVGVVNAVRWSWEECKAHGLAYVEGAEPRAVLLEEIEAVNLSANPTISDWKAVRSGGELTMVEIKGDHSPDAVARWEAACAARKALHEAKGEAWTQARYAAGYKALQAKADAAWNAALRVQDAILLETPPRSIAGVLVVLRMYGHSMDYATDAPMGEADVPELMYRVIVSALEGMQHA